MSNTMRKLILFYTRYPGNGVKCTFGTHDIMTESTKYQPQKKSQEQSRFIMLENMFSDHSAI